MKLTTDMSSNRKMNAAMKEATRVGVTNTGRESGGVSPRWRSLALPAVLGFLWWRLPVLFLVFGSAFGQSWTQTGAPWGAWNSLACSADGRTVVAAPEWTGWAGELPNDIWMSQDGGSTWRGCGAPHTGWYSVVADASGRALAALGDAGVFVSTNAGTNWTLTTAPVRGFGHLAGSADGLKLMATSDLIYRSTDGGVSWTPTSAPRKDVPETGSFEIWSSIASSADGMRVVAAAGSEIYRSPDGGTNWTLSTTNADYLHSLASSADGVRLIGAGQSGFYTSTNAGEIWSLGGDLGYFSWVAASSNGQRLLVVDYFLPNGSTDGPWAYSVDSGVTWGTPQVLSGGGLGPAAMSADGLLCFAGGGGDDGSGWNTPYVGHIYRMDLHVTLQGAPVPGGIQLVWSSGILQAGPSPSGPFTNLAASSSPLVLTNLEPQQFFRLLILSDN